MARGRENARFQRAVRTHRFQSHDNARFQKAVRRHGFRAPREHTDFRAVRTHGWIPQSRAALIPSFLLGKRAPRPAATPSGRRRPDGLLCGVSPSLQSASGSSLRVFCPSLQSEPSVRVFSPSLARAHTRLRVRKHCCARTHAFARARTPLRARKAFGATARLRKAAAAAVRRRNGACAAARRRKLLAAAPASAPQGALWLS